MGASLCTGAHLRSQANTGQGGASATRFSTRQLSRLDTNNDVVSQTSARYKERFNPGSPLQPSPSGSRQQGYNSQTQRGSFSLADDLSKPESAGHSRSTTGPSPSSHSSGLCGLCACGASTSHVDQFAPQQPQQRQQQQEQQQEQQQRQQQQQQLQQEQQQLHQQQQQQQLQGGGVRGVLGGVRISEYGAATPGESVILEGLQLNSQAGTGPDQQQWHQQQQRPTEDQSMQGTYVYKDMLMVTAASSAGGMLDGGPRSQIDSASHPSAWIVGPGTGSMQRKSTWDQGGMSGTFPSSSHATTSHLPSGSHVSSALRSQASTALVTGSQASAGRNAVPVTSGLLFPFSESLDSPEADLEGPSMGRLSMGGRNSGAPRGSTASGAARLFNALIGKPQGSRGSLPQLVQAVAQPTRSAHLHPPRSPSSTTLFRFIDNANEPDSTDSRDFNRVSASQSSTPLQQHDAHAHVRGGLQRRSSCGNVSAGAQGQRHSLLAWALTGNTPHSGSASPGGAATVGPPHSPSLGAAHRTSSANVPYASSPNPQLTQRTGSVVYSRNDVQVLGLPLEQLVSGRESHRQLNAAGSSNRRTGQEPQPSISGAVGLGAPMLLLGSNRPLGQMRTASMGSIDEAPISAFAHLQRQQQSRSSLDSEDLPSDGMAPGQDGQGEPRTVSETGLVMGSGSWTAAAQGRGRGPEGVAAGDALAMRRSLQVPMGGASQLRTVLSRDKLEPSLSRLGQESAIRQSPSRTFAAGWGSGGGGPARGLPPASPAGSYGVGPGSGRSGTAAGLPEYGAGPGSGRGRVSLSSFAPALTASSPHLGSQLRQEAEAAVRVACMVQSRNSISDMRASMADLPIYSAQRTSVRNLDSGNRPSVTDLQAQANVLQHLGGDAAAQPSAASMTALGSAIPQEQQQHKGLQRRMSQSTVVQTPELNPDRQQLARYATQSARLATVRSGPANAPLITLMQPHAMQYAPALDIAGMHCKGGDDSFSSNAPGGHASPGARRVEPGPLQQAGPQAAESGQRILGEPSAPTAVSEPNSQKAIKHRSSVGSSAMTTSSVFAANRGFDPSGPLQRGNVLPYLSMGTEGAWGREGQTVSQAAGDSTSGGGTSRRLDPPWPWTPVEEGGSPSPHQGALSAGQVEEFAAQDQPLVELQGEASEERMASDFDSSTHGQEDSEEEQALVEFRYDMAMTQDEVPSSRRRAGAAAGAGDAPIVVMPVTRYDGADRTSTARGRT